jgi:hypothetical protein
MLTINGNLLGSLTLAVMASVCVIFCNTSATAENRKENGEENGKKNGNENGKENGKENGEDEKEQGWTFKAKLNRAMLFWNDGGRHSPDNYRKRGAYFVDNDQDSSGVEAEGKFKLGEGWTAVIKFSLDAKVGSSNLVSQIDRRQTMEMKIGEATLEIGHERWGKIKVGYGDSASDGVSNINLAGSNVLADAETNNWNDSFFLRAGGMGLTPLRWGDFFAGPNVGETGSFITYVFPKVMGFELAASVGQPLDIFLIIPPVAPFPGNVPDPKPPLIQQRLHGLITDVGLKYSQTWANAFLVKAQVGAFRDTTEDRDAIEPTNDTGWGASVAVRHIATGLNIAVNGGSVKHTDKCAERGAVTLSCRGEDKFLYTKGGIVRKFNAWGPTALYGEFYRGWRQQNSNDEDVLRNLEVNPLQAMELQKSIQTVWGLGVVQTIDATRSRQVTTDLYLGYRNYALDVHLIGANGAAVPTRPINNWSAVMGGVRLRWGKIDKDDD